jgi:hypothetical protein
MSVARTIDARQPPSSGTLERSATTARAVLLAAALTAALLAAAYAAFGPGPGDGYPDPTQQWTD